MKTSRVTIPTIAIADAKSPKSARGHANTTRPAGKTNTRSQSARLPKTGRLTGRQAIMMSSNFGKDAPKITIGCSRHDPPPSIFSPGPGAYDPPRQPINHKLDHIFPRATFVKNAATITSNIDYINDSRFPEDRLIKIGKRDNHDFFPVNDTPGPGTYTPVSNDEGRTAKIGLRRTEREIEESPGPGEYNPNHEFRYSSRSTALVVGAEKRGNWMFQDRNPGPGQYSPDGLTVKPREPAFTIGRKSRRNRRREKKGIIPAINVGIDMFVVQIRDPTMNEADVMEYIRSHKELKTILHDVIDEIMYHKPMAPVGYIRDYFIQMKKDLGWEQPKQTKEEQTEPIAVEVDSTSSDEDDSYAMW